MASNGIVNILINIRNTGAAALRQVADGLRGLATTGRTVTSGIGGLFTGFVQGAKQAAAQYGGFSKILTTPISLPSGLKSFITQLGPLGLLGSIGGLIQAYRELGKAADELSASQRRLAGAAALTQAPLEFIRDLASKGKNVFSLDATEANQFAAEITTIAAKAGDLNKAEGALRDFLNLGAAQGLKTAETLQLISQAADGSDRALKTLFNRVSKEIYEEFARSIGKTVEQLDEAEKATAILAEAQKKGLLVMGEYARFTESTEGRLDDAGDAIKDAAAELGRAAAPMRVFLMETLASSLKLLREFVGGLQLLSLESALTFGKIQVGLKRMKAAALELVGKNEAARVLREQADFIEVGLQLLRDKEERRILGSDFPESAPNAAAIKAANERIAAGIRKKREEEERARRESAQGLNEELSLISKKISLEKFGAEEAKKLDQIEAVILKKLKDQTVQGKQRVEYEQALQNVASVRESIADQAAKKRGEEIAYLNDRVTLHKETATDTARLAELESTIREQLEAGNLTLKARNALQKDFNDLKEVELKLSQRNVTGVATDGRAGRGNNLPGAGTPNLGDSNLAHAGVALNPGDSVTVVARDDQGNAKSDDPGTPKVLQGAGEGGVNTSHEKAIDAATEALEKQQEFNQALRDAVAGPLSDFFTEFMEGFESLDELATSFFKNLFRSIAQLGAQLLASKIVGGLFPAAKIALSAAGAKDGGYVTKRKVVRGYADGGVVTPQPESLIQTVVRRYADGGYVTRRRGYADGGIVRPETAMFLQKVVRKYADGGYVEPEPKRKYAGGGMVRGRGGPRDDLIPAMLSNGEAVLNAKSVAAIGGRPAVDFLNSLTQPIREAPRVGVGAMASAVRDPSEVAPGSEHLLRVSLEDGIIAKLMSSRTGRRALFRVMREDRTEFEKLLPESR